MRRITSIVLILMILCVSVNFRILQVKATSIDFYVKNVNGNLVTDGKAIVKRYDSGWRLLDQKNTDQSGKATWVDVSAETYNFEVYYNGTGGIEFWGDDQVAVSGSQTIQYTRFMPYCIGDMVWIGDTSGNARTDFTAGEIVRVKLTIINKGYWSLRVKSRGIWDLDQIEPYNFDIETDFSPILGSEGTTILTFDFTIPSNTLPGTMRLAYWIYTELLNTNVVVTDTWVWTTYTIKIERSSQAPEKSFIALQFDTESDDDNMASGYVTEDTLNVLPEIKNLLEHYDLEGTFFVQGACFNNDLSGDQFTSEIYQIAGRNEIETHFYSHLEGMSTLPANQIVNELELTERSAGMKFYGSRVPYFDYSDSILNQLFNLGYLYDSSMWSGGDCTPYSISVGENMIYEMPWRCSDHDTAYNVIKGVVDEYVTNKLNMTIVFHTHQIYEDWAGFSQLIQTIADYRSANKILVMTSLQVINYIFGQNMPDLAVSDVDIKVFPSIINNGVKATIRVAIHNIGGIPTGDFSIGLYDGNPSAGGVQLGTTRVNSLDSSLIAFENLTWTATEGTHELYIVADSDRSINELDESNNIAQVKIAVGSPVAPLTVSVIPTSSSINVGQSVMFISSVMGGKATYIYQWYANGTKIVNAVSSSLTFTPSKKGLYEIQVEVADSIGSTAKSNTATLRASAVQNASIEGINISSNNPSKGNSITVTVYIKNTGTESARFYVGGSIIGEGENTWKDLPGWGTSSIINPSATSIYSFGPYVIPADAYIGFHGILISVWSDSSKALKLTEHWYSRVIEVKIPFISELCQKVKLVFSADESFFPVQGLYFDGDSDITNNYQHNAQGVGTYLTDRDGDGEKDVPAYFHIVEESSYYVIECWIYYAYDSFSNHEHDFEYAFFWIDKTTGDLRRVAFNQHRWTNNYEFASDPGIIYIGVEKGGHGMMLLNLNGDSFTIRKPDNCAVLTPGIMGSFGKSSIIASLFPWKVYDGRPVEGFGDNGVLIKGVNYDLIDITVIAGAKPQFYLDGVNAALNTPMLLDSSSPWTLKISTVSIPFYIQAPWTRAVFDDPELQWDKVSFEWWTVKASVKIVTSLVVQTLITNVLAQILVGTIANQVILGLFDPVQASIVDSNGRVLGYRGETLVNEIPGGVIYFNSSIIDAYFIVNPEGDYTYYVKGLDTQNYNMTVLRMNSDGSTNEFDARMIPIDKTTQHKYSFNWTLLTEDKGGMTLLIDANNDGIFERTIQSGSNITGSDLALPWWYNPWWVMAIIALIGICTTAIIFLFKNNRKR